MYFYKVRLFVILVRLLPFGRFICSPVNRTFAVKLSMGSVFSIEAVFNPTLKISLCLLC